MNPFINKMVRSCHKHFTPKLVEVLRKRKYTLSHFKRDCIAALTVTVISIPLAMALAIASGVSPAQGLYTAVIAGFFISLLGGCRYQIGGPTGAFVVVIFTVMAAHGYDGLVMTMLIAGVILILAGLFKIGTYIKYIPYPVVVGFTAGIGILLISTQIKDLLGLQIQNVPAQFLPKWEAYLSNLDLMNWRSVFIALVAAASIFGVKKYRPNWPVYLVSVIVCTALVAVLNLDVDTIGKQFGDLPHFLPMPQLPSFSVSLMLQMLPSGLTIAFLAGVESLLSAKVVDGMSGDNHNSNAELIGEGVANIACTFFAGVPATGAIARTAANYKAGAYSPMSGIMQSVFLLAFMLIFAPAARYIPLTCLAVVLIIIGWNMLNIHKIVTLLQAQPGDRYTLIATLLLTVLVDLNTAISVGFIMASIIFMHRMSHEIEIETESRLSQEVFGGENVTQTLVDKGVMAFRVSGPLFFGGIDDISHFFNDLKTKPKVLILRMGQVPMVDASGANLIVELIKKLRKHNTKIILCNMKRQPRRILHATFHREHVPLSSISAASSFANAVKMARRIVK